MHNVYRCDESFDRSVFSGASCVFGVFDGLHSGHRFLIEQARETAQGNGGAVLALTFDIDPDELFGSESFKKLMANDQRIEALAESGVDGVVVFPFTREFASLDPSDFLARTFGDAAPAFLHVGTDFRFGKAAAGSIVDLQQWGNACGCTICSHALECEGGLPIHATRIRTLLASASLTEANRLLVRPYTLRGEVVRGRGEGGGMGFKTANIITPQERQVLAEGVYACAVELDGCEYGAAVSVGVTPTFKDSSEATTEAHILGYEGNLYGRTIDIEFLEYMRPMMAFENVDDLIAQVTSDIQFVADTVEDRRRF